MKPCFKEKVMICRYYWGIVNLTSGKVEQIIEELWIQWVLLMNVTNMYVYINWCLKDNCTEICIYVYTLWIVRRKIMRPCFKDKVILLEGICTTNFRSFIRSLKWRWTYKSQDNWRIRKIHSEFQETWRYLKTS